MRCFGVGSKSWIFRYGSKIKRIYIVGVSNNLENVNFCRFFGRFPSIWNQWQFYRNCLWLVKPEKRKQSRRIIWCFWVLTVPCTFWIGFTDTGQKIFSIRSLLLLVACRLFFTAISSIYTLRKVITKFNCKIYKLRKVMSSNRFR